MLKKLITIFSIAILSVLCFASCTVSEHNHTKSDWKYSETEHWRVPECDKENCVLEDEVYDLGTHIDDNNDVLCDVCGYQLTKTDTPSSNADDTSTIPPSDDTQTLPTDDTITESKFEKKQYSTSDITINYWLYTPKNATENMPLVVYLHGGSGKGDDLDLITAVDGFPQYIRDGKITPNAYVIIPQVSSLYRGWGEMKSDAMKLISHVSNEYKIDKNKISLTGHSMGGTGAWMLALAYPNTFSAVAPLSGSVNLTNANIEKLKDVPVWAIVGTEDTIVNPQSSVDFINELSKTNQNAKITELEGVDHFTVPSTVYLSRDFDVLAWLISQTKHADK